MVAPGGAGVDETWRFSCTHCAGAIRIFTYTEDPLVIKAILAHLAGKARPVKRRLLAHSLPGTGLLQG